MADPSPLFFSFDGVDGVGKSTQMRLFSQWLRDQGTEVVTCRDPGSTDLGEAIRTLLLDRKELTIGRTAEMLLYMAARAQLVDEVIAPALQRNAAVVSDRYLLANVVYQGHAGGLNTDLIWQIGQTATHGLQPTLTFLLDMPAEHAQQRIQRPLDRMEQQGDDFTSRLRSGFLAEAARQPDRIIVLDATQSIETVHAEIVQHAQRVTQLKPAR